MNESQKQFNELRGDISEVKQQNVELRENMKHDINDMKQQNDNINKRVNDIDERFSTIQKQVLDSANEQFNRQLSEVKENFESKINECNANTEYKNSCTVDKREEVRRDVNMYRDNTDVKVNEIENRCTMEIQ